VQSWVCLLEGENKVGSTQKKIVIESVRSYYGSTWQFHLDSVGVELKRQQNENVTNQIFFNIVRNDVLGVRIQPAVGVTFEKLNQFERQLNGDLPTALNRVSAFVTVNDLLPASKRQNGGWLIKAKVDAEREIQRLIQIVDGAIGDSQFFQNLTSIRDYIAAVDQKRWAFVAVMPMFLYALIVAGETDRALTLAETAKQQSIRIAAERGYVVREGDTFQYDRVIRFLTDESKQSAGSRFSS
jgi:hypothetical protein